MTILRCPRCRVPNRIGPIGSGVPRCARCKALLPWLVTADASSFDAETSASVPVLVDFWAPWCGPCRMVAPVLEDLAARHAGRLKVVKVDVDDEPELSARFHVRSVPLIVVMHHGRELDRILGALPRRTLEARLEPIFERTNHA